MAGRYNGLSSGILSAAISAKDHFMKQGYLVLASERRVLNVVFNDELDAIQQVLGCTAIEHGTTFHTEDQLLITGDELNGAPIDRFWVAGVPFPFAGNACWSASIQPRATLPIGRSWRSMSSDGW